MPGWKFHTFGGVILTILLMTILFGIFRSGIIEIDSGSYFALIVAGFAAILGSDLPDFDYRKTKIRHGLGPVLGGFIAFGYIYSRGPGVNLEIALTIFIVIAMSFAIFAFLPLKHHGKLHSISTACGYGIAWALVSYYVFEIHELVRLAVISGFACAGFVLHLVLDWDLKI